MFEISYKLAVRICAFGGGVGIGSWLSGKIEFYQLLGTLLIFWGAGIFANLEDKPYIHLKWSQFIIIAAVGAMIFYLGLK